MKECSILTPINEAVVVLLVGFASVPFSCEDDVGNSFRAAGGIVMEGNILERSDGGMEQFLFKTRVSTGDKRIIKKTRTDLNLGFIYIHGQVGHDDLFGGLGRRGSGFTGSWYGGGIPGAGGRGRIFPSDGFCACDTTTAADLSS